MANNNPVLCEVTLQFRKSDIQSLLNIATSFGKKKVKVKDLTDKQKQMIFDELKATADNFVEEIIEASDGAMANDWLFDFVSTLPNDED